MNKTSLPGNGQVTREDGDPVNTADLQDEYLGGKGFEIIGDTDPHTPPTGQCYRCLHMTAQTVVAAYSVDASAPIEGTFATATFSAGTVLYGKFTSITLTSGNIIAYKGVL